MMALTVNLLLFSALILAVQPLTQYSCPNDALQLITRTDVSQYTSNFNDVLSVSSYEILYWGASINNVPSNGILTFREPFVLIGLTSAGEYISSTERYVNHFLLSSSPSLNSSFQNLTNSFITTNPNEVSFFFEEPILSHRLQLYIISAVAPITSFFYWRINLIGCPLSNASFSFETYSSTIPSPSNTFTTLTPSMQSCLPSYIGETVPVTRYVTVYETVVRSPSSSIPPLPSMITTTSTDTQEAGRSCQGAVTAAVVVPILILVVVAAVLIILFILYRYRQKSGISKIWNAFKGQIRDKRRASTLKEVDNKALYYNAAYNSIDINLPRSSISLPLPSIPENQAPVYSEVNVYEDAPEIEAKGGEGALYESPSVMSD